MIRPLRRLHRAVWPVMGALAFTAIALAAQLKHAQPGQHHAHAVTAEAGQTAFVWQWASRGDQTLLVATPSSPLRSSTGVADVYRIDQTDQTPVYVASLAAFIGGVSMPAPGQQVTLRIFDVANNVWLDDAFSVAGR